MESPLRLTFVTSAAEIGQLPTTRAEVAVVGRSNVGKSSLLNALAGSQKVAKVSGKPGRTQLLNLFRLEELDATLVDLPGYGYAATVSQQTRKGWDRRMRSYLTGRPGLRAALVLIDGAVGPTRLDQEMLAWLRGKAVPFRLVATKQDKVKSSQRERRKRDLAAGCEVGRDDVVWVSAVTGHGIEPLRRVVRATLTGPGE